MTNVMRASMWYEFFYGFFLGKKSWYMGEKRENKEWDLY